MCALSPPRRKSSPRHGGTRPRREMGGRSAAPCDRSAHSSGSPPAPPPRSARRRASISLSPPLGALGPASPSPRIAFSRASMSGSSVSAFSCLRFCFLSIFFFAAQAVYGSVHHTGPPFMPSPEAQLTQPVVMLGMIWPPRCARGTRQMLAVPKLEFALSMALSEQRISKPGLRHLEMSAASTTFSRTRNSYSSRLISCCL
mmetsp:Transcript_2687/g.5871  ORF Transcript_2687/g.5871 Transcript_2687/m.5871 type:complete len:201 (+) Transcript_2687:45-647(+)